MSGEPFSLYGVKVYAVEPGTVIEDPDTGEREAVPENGALVLRNRMYCVPVVFDRLKTEFGVKDWPYTMPPDACR